MVKKKRADLHSEEPAVPEIAVGDVVEIHGLLGAKELNGRRGRVVAFVEETQRFGVRLEGEDESKAVKPANLRRLPRPVAAPASFGAATAAALSPASMAFGPRMMIQQLLGDVMQRLQAAEEGSEEQLALQRELEDLVSKLQSFEEQEADEDSPAMRPRRVPHQPLPPTRSRESPKESLPRQAPQPRASLPPPLPEWPPQRAAPSSSPPEYSDEHEYPDIARAYQAGKALLAGALCGVFVSQVDLVPATWFVWSFLVVHLLGVAFLSEYSEEQGLLLLCAAFGLHAGQAASEFGRWTLGTDGEDSVGPWSLLVFFASLLYFHSFWMECVTLPPDYITSISLFFPMFPAFNAAVVMSCVELFLEWRYFPEYKIWNSAVAVGITCMALGQGLIAVACRTANRNFWASCRNAPEEEDKAEDLVGLEIPDRRVVHEGVYRWERHPAYLGAMLWGIGVEIALCNPIMLLVVGFVLWASLLYVALEEEQELYDEFKGSYANYAALTRCWIPLFNTFLENAAFQREMSDNCEEPDDEPEGEELEDEEGEEGLAEDAQSEDDLLPTWEGVPKGGALWNRQFRDPWILG